MKPARFHCVSLSLRVVFFWTILRKPESELVKQALRAQQILPVKNYGWLKVCDDLVEYDINLSESEISMSKKSTFKRLIDSKVREASRKYLTQLKNKHSKSNGLTTYKLQTYLTSNALTTEKKQLLFKPRTRTYNCKANFRNQYGQNINCSICGFEDNQQHLLFCSRTTANVDIDGVTYSDIFGTLQKQVKVIKFLMKVTRNRKIIIENSFIMGSQVHL